VQPLGATRDWTVAQSVVRLARVVDRVRLSSLPSVPSTRSEGPGKQLLRLMLHGLVHGQRLAQIAGRVEVKAAGHAELVVDKLRQQGQFDLRQEAIGFWCELVVVSVLAQRRGLGVNRGSAATAGGDLEVVDHRHPEDGAHGPTILPPS
jgi:hypothetical protein